MRSLVIEMATTKIRGSHVVSGFTGVMFVLSWRTAMKRKYRFVLCFS